MVFGYSNNDTGIGGIRADIHGKIYGASRIATSAPAYQNRGGGAGNGLPVADQNPGATYGRAGSGGGESGKLAWVLGIPIKSAFYAGVSRKNSVLRLPVLS